ncbi:TIGR02266 family protein [Corallococcus exiguus]|uniref:TIGR02266 family protein n=1 Tax=Corallococcus exiguus TaxID=83462 RepID=A0A7X4Y580_9BACT|nr:MULTISPECIES: TIGR02266 family protein [Corallococcus]RKI48245.1 TIGR02266 family protein [Corallococcus sp. AB004]MBN8469714.1 TIGR02266 family protein [Corallococcus exiguus]NBC39099.1 TIGR02266 family protein [Corallococcus exiguus]NNC14623.1 TIGR02266 family protein [Corallococcus exiguus]NRD55478.1 TIGR02266 family protein [Corallococcus exiguus]
MSLDPADQRQHPRIPTILRVDYAHGRPVRDVTENLSTGGFFVQTEQLFAVGDELRLALSFPGLLDPVEVAGTVAWVRLAAPDQPGGVGIRVESEQDRRRLGDILSAAGPNDNAVTPSEQDGFRVLIVEDNPHIIEMYSYVLKKLASNDLHGKVPLEVHFAPDGHHALLRLREDRFSLVMLDLYMPVMDGFALVERIREEEELKGIPVIAISAGGKEAQDRAMQLGVDIYLRKPVRFVEVLETVKQLLRIR